MPQQPSAGGIEVEIVSTASIGKDTTRACSCPGNKTLLAHFAIRQLMAQTAWPRGLDPDRLSFSHAARVIKRKMPQAAAAPP